jgi:L-cysteine S-thiosulfotransferase
MGVMAALVLGAVVVVGDGIAQPLTTTPGDAQRGRALVGSRQHGLCLLCHSGPVSADFPKVQLQGNLATNLQGAGARWSEAQLRLRIVDSRRLNPDSLMPALHRSEGLQRVGRAWQGQPVLDAQQVEDVVAYLLTLR